MKLHLQVIMACLRDRFHESFVVPGMSASAFLLNKDSLRGHMREQAVLSLMVIVFSTVSAAADRVTYLPSDSRQPVTLTGTILDYTGQKLVIQQTGQPIWSLSTSSILDVQAEYDPAHVEGIESFQRGETFAAESRFQKALQRESRHWIKRELQAWLARCAMRQNDHTQAIHYFRLVVQDDPQTAHWSLAPLVWSSRSIDSQLRQEAVIWLTNESAADRLLAASLLLADEQNSRQSREVLEKLSRGADPILAALSRAQLWRVDLSEPDKLDSITIGRWRGQIQEIPVHLRSGPQMLIGRGYQLLGEYRRAAAEWMWVPMIYSENEIHSARALLDAGEAMQRAGLVNESQILKRELLRDFSWSREAAQVKSHRQDLIP